MKKFTRYSLAMCAAVMTLSISAMAGEWKSDENGYWYVNDDGSCPVSQWQEIDGKQYYFGSDGYMYHDTVTPDGYTVGSDGAWIEKTGPKYTNLTYSADSVSQSIDVADYIWEPGRSTSYSNHVYVVKNNTGITIRITTNEIAYDSAGNVIGAGDERQVDIPDGITTCFDVYFDGVTDIDHFDATFQVLEEPNYQPVIQNIGTSISDRGDKLIVTAVNNGDVAVEFAKGHALFFDDGELVSMKSTYFTDDDHELKPGASLSEQLSPLSTVSYDSYQVYFTGRADK